MEISKQYISQSAAKRPMIKMTPKWLTIHSTANAKSTAQNEHDFLASPENKRQASFHLVVDEMQAIMCIPLNEVAYHAGDGQGDGNRASISLEICESGNRTKTLDNAAQIAAQLLAEYGWSIDKVVQHNKWSGKDCPRILREGNQWQEFLALIALKLKALQEEVYEVKDLAVIMPDTKEVKLKAIEVENANFVGIRDILERLGYKVGYVNGKVVIQKDLQ